MGPLKLLEGRFWLLTSIGVAMSSLLADSNESSESSIALVSRLVLGWISLKPVEVRVPDH